jgi:hypothetical protein
LNCGVLQQEPQCFGAGVTTGTDQCDPVLWVGQGVD